MEIIFAFCISATAGGGLLNPRFEPHNEMQCTQTATWSECEGLALAVINSNAEPTFGPERRQCGGFRPFKRSGLNSRFVPSPDIEVVPLRWTAWQRS